MIVYNVYNNFCFGLFLNLFKIRFNIVSFKNKIYYCIGYVWLDIYMGIVFLLYDGYKLNIIILVDLFDIEILIIFIGDKFIEK